LKIVTYSSFIFAVSVVILNLVSLIFPAFLVTLFEGTESDTNSFELGAWAFPLLAINIPFLIYGVLYNRKKIPNKISKSFEFILNFEVSRNTTIIVFSIMISIYIILTVGELFQNEIDVWKDWEILEPIIDRFPTIDEGPRGMRIQIMNNFLLFSSQEIFQNVKVIPFLGSISLIFLVYFLTVIITKKKICWINSNGNFTSKSYFLEI